MSKNNTSVIQKNLNPSRYTESLTLMGQFDEKISELKSDGTVPF